MDEILSYELSNSEFTPWITPTQPEGRLEKYYRNEIYDENFLTLLSNLFSQAGDILKNRGGSVAASYSAEVYDKPQWMSSEDMKEYVLFYTRDSVPGFSAYYNTTTDNHPPLYFMTINLFSAVYALFALGKLSVWPGCVLNMIFMGFSMLCIIAIFRDIFAKKNIGIAAALYYGLSPAGINTVLLIRMYAMCGFFCLAFTYELLRKVKAGEDFKKNNKRLILITVLGFLTQYFTCIYFFFLTSAVLIHLLRKKEKKASLYLIRSMVISAFWGILIYPFVFHDFFGTKVGESVRGSLSETGGLPAKLGAFVKIAGDSVLWSYAGAAAGLIIFVICLIAAVKKKKDMFLPLSLTLSSLGYLLVVSKIAPYTVDRYLMPVFPIMILCISLGMTFAVTTVTGRMLKTADSLEKVHKISFAVCMAAVIIMTFFVPSPYLYKGYSSQKRLSDTFSAYDCVVIYRGTSFYRNVPELINYQNCLLLKEDEIYGFDERLAGLDRVVVIVGEGVDESAAVATLGRMYGFSSVTALMEQGVFGDRVCILSK